MPAIAMKRPTLLQRIEAGEIDLPMLPDFAMKILRKIENGGSAADVSPAVEKDQALSAQMVRLANSAFYAGSERVRSVSQAVVRVGVRSVASFVAANVQKSMYVSRDPVRGAYLKDLWRHALGVATVGQHVAKVLREPDASSHFLAGLLHDIGKTAIVVLSPPPLKAAVWAPPDALASIHAEAGRLLLKKWRLPEDVTVSVAHHHHPHNAGPNQRLAAAIAVADAVCCRVGIAPKSSHEWSQEAEKAAADILGLSEIACADLEVELEDRVAELDSILGG